jgi:hypothetical protein
MNEIAAVFLILSAAAGVVLPLIFPMQFGVSKRDEQ